MSDALTEAQKLYNEALDAQREQRQQIQEDLEFSDPSDPQQWDPMVKMQREQDPGGKRPCLVMDQTGQYVANVAGQIEQRPPSIHAIPVGGGADKQAAEQIDGRFRHIEHVSRASQHYARVLTSAARTGVGYLIVRPEYVDRALGWQEPRISSEANPLNMVFDPWSVETDGSDGTFAFLLTPLSVREFERRWPKAEKCDFGAADTRRDDRGRRSIIVAEAWQRVDKTRQVLVWLGADGQETSGTEDEYWQACQAAGVQLQFLRKFSDKSTEIQWKRMTGDAVLEESIYPADSIGVVPMYGYVGFRSDGRMMYCGIPRRARAPQQAYNYHISEELAYIATAPKSPWVASARALKGYETLWDKAAIQSRAVLPFNDMDEEGAIATPQRTNVATNVVNHQQGAERALHDIQASIGMYQANLGAPSNESSGVAIDARKQQGEASTAHFPAHMAASLAQVGKIVMQMDARLTDDFRRQPIIGLDESPGSIIVDPKQETAFARTREGDASVNPRIGTYGVRVVVGASYATQRSQTNAAFTEIMRGNPELAPTVAPFWAQTFDFPGADKFAQAMAAMAPAPVKAILQPEGNAKGPDPAALAQQVDQLKQALQEAIQHAKEAQDDADQAIADVAEAKRVASVRARELDIKSYEAETDRLKVTGANAEQIQLVVRDLIEQMLQSPDPLPGDPPQMHQPMAPQMPEAPEVESQEVEPMQGPGMDGTAPHEMAEGEAPEPAEINAPSMEQQQ